ncbi:28S ribosomal protein S31, mitochondrial [Hyposmocoma kahamanoa]|uniref:28S ribosomal protein S31, mitochondrial n=1 Tax=Hyposmocoma kahamanoa TaxID=1477025 RepID=UPI000E6D6307|nr:28S ribosomal protein S31, mitochondrial [Hyposmocoma kahamanoa]
MLTRFRFRRDFRLIARSLSDKPSGSDERAPESKIKETNTSVKKEKKASESTEKIQALLKMMLEKPKISQQEYEDQFTVAPERPRRHKQLADEIEVKTEKIEESITKAAGEVAQAIGGDVKQTEAELLSKVLGKINQTSTSLSDLLVGMKVDRSKDSDNMLQREMRGQQVKRLVDKSNTDVQRSKETTRYTQRKMVSATQISKKGFQTPKSIDINSGTPLGIFKGGEPKYGTKLDMWEGLKQRELSLATAQPPTNYFQKMVLWTEQGKVWKFPIDNEQGMEEENNIHFSEHIFLDSHLESWCPKKGPIRHFMELVCVGLSKNPFYTVKEKKDHIMWYKEYFEAKKDILVEVGAWDPKLTSASSDAST